MICPPKMELVKKFPCVEITEMRLPGASKGSGQYVNVERTRFS